MSLPKKDKAPLRSGAEIARQLFIYGDGDGRPITDVKTLAALADVHIQTVQRYLPQWMREREKMLVKSTQIGIGIRLSEEELNAHESDMVHLRTQLSQVKWESDNLDDVIEKLGEWVDRISNKTDMGDIAVKLLEQYINASLNKQNLRKQFVMLQTQWTKLSGIVDLKDVAVTSEKEKAKGRAKIDLKREEMEAGMRDVGSDRSGMFARSGQREIAGGETAED